MIPQSSRPAFRNFFNLRSSLQLRSISRVSTQAPITATRLHQSQPSQQYQVHRRPYSKMASKDNSQFTRANLFDLTGKVALVTGGGSGIGLMATQALAANGATVYISGRTQSKLDAVVQKYNQSSNAGEIIALPGDVGNKEGVRKLYQDFTLKGHKSLDILVNNAGVSNTSGPVEAKSGKEMREHLFESEDSTFEDWSKVWNTNVTSQFFVASAFLDLLEKSTEVHEGWSGTVIFITSISGLIQKSQHHFAYNASKGAAVHVTRMLAAEIAENRLKIRCNGIAPGVFPSEMTAKDSDEDQKSHIEREKYDQKVPARRPGKDEDMAQTVLYFAVNQYLNGQTLAVDGGYTLSAGM